MTPGQLDATVGAIAGAQRPDGLVPWFAGGKADPWDHVEAAMALTAGGRRRAAERAYDWLAANQRADGSWACAYIDGEVADATGDANFTAYGATGVWHHWLATGDDGFLAALWPTVERAVGYVLDLQTPGGEVVWSRDPQGRPTGTALLASSSSIHLSLRCALAAAERLGHERPDWELSIGALAHAVRHHPEAFEDKARYSMDWYYPVLGGVVVGAEARARLRGGWGDFVVEGRGVRCVDDEPWVTVAETCEAVIALAAAGLAADAHRLFRWVQYLRAGGGWYWTGHNWICDQHYPEGERTTWTAAAVVLAAATLAGAGPTGRLFRGEGLPAGLDPGCELRCPAAAGEP